MPRVSVVARKALTRRRGKKWSPVLIEKTLDTQIGTNTGRYVSSWTLCANSGNTGSAPTATVIKCGNFKLWMDNTTNLQSSAPVHGFIYIMFLPQGVTVSDGLPDQHPEWIMAWRGYDVQSQSLQAFSVQSKLKRNLNSGDSIILLNMVIVSSGLQASFYTSIHMVASYVCCNN